MTFDDVCRTGAEFIRFSWKTPPLDGWKELDAGQLRNLIAESDRRLKSAATSSAHQDAQAFKTGATVGLERLEAGARVFWVPMRGTAIFSATKVKKEAI
jgi:hypothetical protein